MTPDRNKALVRRFYAELDAGNDAALAELLDEKFTLHLPEQPEPLDLAGFVQFGRAFATAFPDVHHTIITQLAEEELVATHLQFTGTHQGELNGQAATGRMVDVTAMNIHRVVDGRILEHWLLLDRATMGQQLQEPS